MKKILGIIFVIVFITSGCSISKYQTTQPTSSSHHVVTPPTSTPSKTPPVIPPASTKKIALTFDDGPYGTSTAQILDILKEKNVPATFFILGKQVERFPDQARRIVYEGHSIGNHSYDHAQNLARISAEEFRKNLDKAQEIIFNTTNISPKIFRPPYGSLSETMKKVLSQYGYRTVLWNIDPEDWNYASSTSHQIVERVLKHAKPDAIILLHDGRDTHINFPRDNTVGALPILIDSLREKGYTFVTVDKLMGLQK